MEGKNIQIVKTIPYIMILFLSRNVINILSVKDIFSYLFATDMYSELRVT